MAIIKRVRADGSNAYRVVVHNPIQGHVTIGTFDRKKDAELAELEAKRNAALEGTVFVSKKMSFIDLSAEWLKTRRVRKQTQVTYSAWRGYMVDFFGDTPITKIDRAKCEEFIAWLDKSKLAPTTANVVFSLFRAIMRYAVECGYLRRNPAEGVKRLREPRSVKIRVVTPQQHKEAVEAAPDFAKTMIFVWAFIGLRVGEMMGLMWDDIDLKNNCLHVRRQRATNGVGRFMELKTEASYRTVYFPPIVSQRLAEHRMALRHAENEGKDGLVFPSPWGEPWSYQSLLERVFKPIRKSVKGLKELTPHDWRHTMVSWLIEQGADIKYVQDQCGHADASTTLDVYGHLWRKDRQSFVSRMQAWYVADTSPDDEKPQVVSL